MAVLLAALARTVLVSAPAFATDSDLKHSAILKVRASDGFSILVVANSERPDGRGNVALIVYGRHESVTYAAPATITATRFEADLGALGGIALDVIPSGREKTLRTGCGNERDSISFEPLTYRGSFEFHGEEGYTEASTAAPREFARFLFAGLCAGGGSGELSGPDLPGARLRLHARRGSFRLNLQANKNRPGAPTRIEVATHEERRGIDISRHRMLWAGAGALRYDPLLRAATLDPPAPFSGRAGFRRDASPANRWAGNLKVDLPGRSGVPLTSAAVGVTLRPSCWQGEGAGGRAECGF